MNSGEYGNFAERESNNMEVQKGFQLDLDKLRTHSYTTEQFGMKRKNLTELGESVQ